MHPYMLRLAERLVTAMEKMSDDVQHISTNINDLTYNVSHFLQEKKGKGNISQLSADDVGNHPSGSPVPGQEASTGSDNSWQGEQRHGMSTTHFDDFESESPAVQNVASMDTKNSNVLPLETTITYTKERQDIEVQGSSFSETGPGTAQVGPYHSAEPTVSMSQSLKETRATLEEPENNLFVNTHCETRGRLSHDMASGSDISQSYRPEMAQTVFCVVKEEVTDADETWYNTVNNGSVPPLPISHQSGESHEMEGHNLDFQGEVRGTQSVPVPEVAPTSSYMPKYRSKRCRVAEASERIRREDWKWLITMTAKGKVIKKFFDHNGLISADIRRMLVNLVGERIAELTQSPKPADYMFVEEQIIAAYPSEKKGTYFIPAQTNGPQQRNSEGKLPNFVRNFKHRSKKKLGFGALDSSNSEEGPQEPEPQDSPEVINAERQLRENCLTMWEDIVWNWTLTHRRRTRSLQASWDANIPPFGYFDSYLMLRLPLGYSLLELDFDLKFPNIQSFSEWKLKRKVLIKLIELECDTTEAKEIKEKYNSSSEEQKDSIALLSIPLLFRQAHAKKRTAQEIQSTSSRTVVARQSTAEVLEGFVLHVASPSDVERARLHQLAILRREQKLQPFVIAVGHTKEEIPSAYCCIDNMQYNLPSLKKALDVCFKSFHALHACYPTCSLHVWLFLQQTLYDLYTPYDKQNSHLTTLVGNFKALCEIQRNKSCVAPES